MDPTSRYRSSGSFLCRKDFGPWKPAGTYGPSRAAASPCLLRNPSLYSFSSSSFSEKSPVAYRSKAVYEWRSFFINQLTSSGVRSWVSERSYRAEPFLPSALLGLLTIPFVSALVRRINSAMRAWMPSTRWPEALSSKFSTTETRNNLLW